MAPSLKPLCLPHGASRESSELRATRDIRGIAEIRGKKIVHLRQLKRGQSIITNLQGFGDNAKVCDITVENRKVGAGVRIAGDSRPGSAAAPGCARLIPDLVRYAC